MTIMRLNEVAERLSLTVLNPGDGLDRKVTGGYASDLLSDVLGHAPEGAVWITLQIHRNIVAVAACRGIAAILLIGGAIPGEETLALARQEGIPVLSTSMPAFEAAGRLFALLKAHAL